MSSPKPESITFKIHGDAFPNRVVLKDMGLREMEFVPARPAPVGGVDGIAVPKILEAVESEIDRLESNIYQDHDSELARLSEVDGLKSALAIIKGLPLSRLSPEPVGAPVAAGRCEHCGVALYHWCPGIEEKTPMPELVELSPDAIMNAADREYCAGNAHMEIYRRLREYERIRSAPLPVEWKGDAERLRNGFAKEISASRFPQITEEFRDDMAALDRLADALESTHRRAEGLEAERDRLREALETIRGMSLEHEAVNHCATQALTTKEMK